MLRKYRHKRTQAPYMHSHKHTDMRPILFVRSDWLHSHRWKYSHTLHSPPHTPYAIPHIRTHHPDSMMCWKYRIFATLVVLINFISRKFKIRRFSLASLDFNETELYGAENWKNANLPERCSIQTDLFFPSFLTLN